MIVGDRLVLGDLDHVRWKLTDQLVDAGIHDGARAQVDEQAHAIGWRASGARRL